MTSSPESYLLFLGGAFAPSESGRTVAVASGEGTISVAIAAPDDLVAALRGAEAAFGLAALEDPLARGRRLHCLAERVWQQRDMLVAGLQSCTKLCRPDAETELRSARDRLLYYAGFCDKYAALLGRVEIAASGAFGTSLPVPCGAIAVLLPAAPGLAALFTCLAPVLVPGNSAVVLAPPTWAPLLRACAELLIDCGFAPGLVQLLTGNRAELLPALGPQHALAGVLLADPAEGELAQIEESAAVRGRPVHVAVRRERWDAPGAQGLVWIEPFVTPQMIWQQPEG